LIHANAPLLLILSNPVVARMQLARITCKCFAADCGNHANDKIFSPRGNFTSSTMARDGGATIPQRILSLIVTRHDAAAGKIVCK